MEMNIKKDFDQYSHCTKAALTIFQTLKKILFITWDSDKTNYMENLFFPIFSALQERGDMSVSIVQFSWAESHEVNRISGLAKERGLDYVHIPVTRSLPAALASLKAIFSSRARLIAYVRSRQIQTIIARSTMPALLSLILLKRLRKMGCEIIFDADGLPIQERLDLGNLRKGSLMHRVLAGIEQRMLIESDKVLIRTQQAIDWHLDRFAKLDRDKFFQVGNGRDAGKFYFDPIKRREIRKMLGAEDELILVHAGSLGPGYALDLLFRILTGLKENGTDYQMVFLCRDSDDLAGLVPESVKAHVKVLEPDFEAIPAYLMAADLGISLRLASDGAKGLLPIKIGEYLMCGLPVLLSKGIGDLDTLLGNCKPCYMIENHNFDLFNLNNWLKNICDLDKKEISSLGNELFSLESTLDQYERAIR